MPAVTQGRLIVVPTPIGNLEDISLRALRWLKDVSIIACEDTRRTQKILNHFQISTPVMSFYQEVEKRKTPELLSRMEQGQAVALVSDAGMPGISDPGQWLIQETRKKEIAIEVLPGPSAVMTALVGSGLPISQFTFYGFPEAKSTQRIRFFESIQERQETMIFFVTPHKLIVVLKEMEEVWGNRQAVLCRELTKIHEEFVAGTLSDLQDKFRDKSLGEMTLIVSGGLNSKPKLSENLDEHLKRYVREGASINQAVAKVAKERGLPRNEVYRFAHTSFKKEI